MTLTIGVDVDGVLADSLRPWVARLCAKHNIGGFTSDYVDRWDFWNQIGITEDEMWAEWTPDIYKDTLPYDDAYTAISELRDVQGHDIVYVTSCQTPEEYGAKVMWLGKHGFAKGCRTVAVGKWAGYKHKYEVPGLDWLIDDNVGHCTGFKGYALLVTRSHNKRDLYPGKRIRGMGDVPMLAQYGKQTFFGPGIVEAQKAVAQADGDESPWRTLEIPLREQVAKSEVAAPASGAVLPGDWSSRKDIPLCTGVFDYFPLALAEVARVSKAGNDQHNPGMPLHWARGKSTDHADCVVRHIVDRGTLDVDGQRHSAKAAWRMLALLQEEMEDALAGRPGYVNPNRRDGQTEQKAA